MLQRSQTLWLLLAVITAALSFSFPFVVGQELIDNNPVQIVIDAGSNLYLLINTAIVILLAFVSIFLYKNRKKQSWIVALGLIFSSLLLFLYILEMQKLVHPVPALTCLFAVMPIPGFILALVGIRKDEKLIKSLDSLR
jgi:peptidoglycan/LPS O-acetylase OafA/YrhL